MPRIDVVGGATLLPRGRCARVATASCGVRRLCFFEIENAHEIHKVAGSIPAISIFSVAVAIVLFMVLLLLGWLSAATYLLLLLMMMSSFADSTFLEHTFRTVIAHPATINIILSSFFG